MTRKTITDVAAAAGVAIKTVSRVLNNEPKVRESTRERVMAAVKALNYHPSISARGLAGRRSFLVGLVYENPSANYVMDVQNGTMARCREERFQLIMHHCSGRGTDLAGGHRRARRPDARRWARAHPAAQLLPRAHRHAR